MATNPPGGYPSFEAGKQGGAVLLQWQTANEINVASYTCRKKRQWKRLQQHRYRTGRYNGINNYSLVDHQPLQGLTITACG